MPSPLVPLPAGARNATDSTLRCIVLLCACAILVPGCAYGSLTYGSELPIQRDAGVRGRLVDAHTGEPIAGAQVTAHAVNPGLSPPAGEPTTRDGRFDLRMELVIGVAGRSPLAGDASDPLPPRRPLRELEVRTADGRTFRIDRPVGTWRRSFDAGYAERGLLVYDVGTVRLRAQD